MDTTTTQDQAFQNGLNIHLVSFSLPKYIIKEKEQIRVSITTLPDGTKQHFKIKGKLMNYTNHLFSLNISNITTTIVMVFRKKKAFSDTPIIASTTINLKNFKEMPKKQINEGIIDSEIQSVNLYYPLQKQIREEHQKNIKRKILGSMKIKLSFTTPFSNVEHDKSKINNKSGQRKSSKGMRNNTKISDYTDLCDSESSFAVSLM